MTIQDLPGEVIIELDIELELNEELPKDKGSGPEPPPGSDKTLTVIDDNTGYSINGESDSVSVSSNT